MILLDTCTLLWLVTNRGELSRSAARAIDSADQVFVSAASAFEIGAKWCRGKLALPLRPRDWWRAAIDRFDLIELAITPAVAFESTMLPTEIMVDGRTIEHRDPGDRFIVATANAHGLTVITPDPKIAAYPGTGILW